MKFLMGWLFRMEQLQRKCWNVPNVWSLRNWLDDNSVACMNTNEINYHGGEWWTSKHMWAVWSYEWKDSNRFLCLKKSDILLLIDIFKIQNGLCFSIWKEWWTNVYLFMGELLLILKNNIIPFFKNENWVILQNRDLRNGKKPYHFPCLLIGKWFFLKCQVQKTQLIKHEQFDLKNIFPIWREKKSFWLGIHYDDDFYVNDSVKTIFQKKSISFISLLLVFQRMV